MQRMSYDDAVAALYQAPHGEFVAERKRLAADLKAAGDKAGATRLGKLPRPPISAWTVNQLWWQARDDFDALFESAGKLRKGDLRASGEHRDLMAKLRQRASTILTEAGHAATESTLRRVTTTLAALAASGSFDPDPPGALAADRDPPGFEAVGIVGAPVERAPSKPKPEAAAADDDDDGGAAKRAKADKAAREEREAEEKRQLAEAAAERRRKEQAEAKRRAALRQVETALASAKTEVERKQKDVDRLRKAVETAEAAVEKSQATVDELEAKLAELAAEEED
jgi:hypothetical protein